MLSQLVMQATMGSTNEGTLVLVPSRHFPQFRYNMD